MPTEKQLRRIHLVEQLREDHTPDEYKRFLFNCLFFAVLNKERLQKRMARRKLAKLLLKEGLSMEEGQKQMDEYLKELQEKIK